MYAHTLAHVQLLLEEPVHLVYVFLSKEPTKNGLNPCRCVVQIKKKLFSSHMFGRQRPWWASFCWEQHKDRPYLISIPKSIDFELNVGFILMASKKASEIYMIYYCRLYRHGRLFWEVDSGTKQKMQYQSWSNKQHGEKRSFIEFEFI